MYLSDLPLATSASLGGNHKHTVYEVLMLLKIIRPCILGVC